MGFTIYIYIYIIYYSWFCDILSFVACYSFKGSSAFVYGWVAFADRLSNGVIVKIIQQATPHSQDRYCMHGIYA